MSLLLALTAITVITPGGGVERKRNKRQRQKYEVDQFENVTIEQNKSDDDECLLLLLM